MFGPRAPARLGARSGLLALLRVMVCVPSASSPSQGLVNCVPPSSVPRTGYRYWHVPMWHGYNTVWFRMIFNLTKADDRPRPRRGDEYFTLHITAVRILHSYSTWYR
jgi:hypothetical protein